MPRTKTKSKARSIAKTQTLRKKPPVAQPSGCGYGQLSASAARGRVRRTFKNIQSNFAWLGLAVLIICMDQISKYLVSHNLFPEECIYINQVLNICYIFNTGAAFSFLAEATGWQEWVFGSLAVFVSFGIVYWLFRESKKLCQWSKIALMLVLGGAIGNLVDRLLYQHVRDFLDFHWQLHHWPVFNFADIAICVGAAMLVFEILHNRD